MKSKLLCCLIILSLTGCATVPKLKQPFEKNKVFNVSFEEVLKAVQGLPIKYKQIHPMNSKIEADFASFDFQESIPLYRIEEVALVPKGRKYAFADAKVKIVLAKKDQSNTTVMVDTKIDCLINGPEGVGASIFLALLYIPVFPIDMALGSPLMWDNNMASTGVFERMYFERILEALWDQ